VEVC
jgi:hypothetical protein